MNLAVMRLPPPLSRTAATLLGALHARAFAGAVGADWSAEALATLAALPGTGTFLAQADGAPAGLLLARVAGADTEILTFAVDPPHRRAGCGRALLRAAADWAAAQRLERLVLEVAVSNLPALALYRRCSFAEAGRRRGYYRGGSSAVDAFVMVATVEGVLNETGPGTTEAWCHD